MRKFGLLLVLIAGIFLTACGGGDEPDAGTDTEPAAESGDDGAETPADRDELITLVVNPWPASELNVAVAQILLEQELGYENIETVNLEGPAQWDVLAAGDADAVLEVWPSGHATSIEEYINVQGVIEDGGALGPEGLIGWFVPTYVVDEHPELATWEGFQDPELAAMFATAETGTNGRFLGAEPSWVQYDKDIITNLGLPLEVVWSGSEDALLAEVDATIAREEPILFYFYTPHAIFDKFDMTQVELPPYTEECYADADNGSVACAYPPDVLMKAFATDLSERAPEAYALLSNFSYTNADQVAMLGANEGGLSIEEAAQQWIDNNESVWSAWLP